MWDLLAGLKFLHEQQVVHCDLKLSNLLVDADAMHMQITDFGLAVPALTSRFASMLAYVCPEAALGRFCTSSAGRLLLSFNISWQKTLMRKCTHFSLYSYECSL